MFSSSRALVCVVAFAVGCGSSTGQEDNVLAGSSLDESEDTSSEIVASTAALRASVDPVTNQISATEKQWSFVDVPESKCANGAPTGFGVNPVGGSREMVIYLVGGGACWNAATCGIGTAANVRKGYSGSDFDADGIREWSMFSRAEPQNPFRDMSQVIVPYCTADVHAGTKTTNYGVATIAHHGALNVEAMLVRLKATYPELNRVIVVGTSAGGFGAQLNFSRFTAAFPGAEIDVLADSGQMVTPKGTLPDEWANNWGLVVPSGCVGCLGDYPKYVGYLLMNYPASKFGLFASLRDATLTPFFGFGINVQAFRGDTASLLVEQYDRSPNGSYLARAGVRHGYLNQVKKLTSRENKDSFEFLRAFVAGTAVSKRPF
jgi:hypothetical protein